MLRLKVRHVQLNVPIEASGVLEGILGVLGTQICSFSSLVFATDKKSWEELQELGESVSLRWLQTATAAGIVGSLSFTPASVCSGKQGCT